MPPWFMVLAGSTTSATETFEQLLVKRAAHSPQSNLKRLRNAFRDAVTDYGDSMHWTKESVIDHCLGVLRIYLHFDPDDDAVIACLLHHLLERKQWTLGMIEEKYGEAVRDIISGEHLLAHVTLQHRRMPLERLRSMFLQVSGDLRLVLLVLSQQLHLLDRMDYIEDDLRKHMCRDTLHILAPVAARLGVYWLKNRLEARAFPVLYPVDATRIAEQLEHVHRKYDSFLPRAAKELTATLAAEGLTAVVEAREKQPYSIFHKMQGKSVTHVEDLYDLFALRVIVQSEAECYQALGVLHRIGHPVAGRFKDYIAFPKPNGYKSLHTTLARLPSVPEGVFLEAQIRTQEMHRLAEFGFAAHWSYKQRVMPVLSDDAGTYAALVSSAHDRQPHASDRIFVLTPQGDIIELPEGATPLDFAFYVHTSLGLSFKAAKVNGSIAPMDYALENGDIVEILRHADPHPSPRWMTLLKTASARSRLKKFLALEQRPMLVALGRDSLNEELHKHHLPSLDGDLKVLERVNGGRLSFEERENFLAAIGQGTQHISTALSHIDAYKQITPSDEHERAVKAFGYSAFAKVEGNIPMPVLYAKCCKPREKQCPAIAGVISRGGDVRVHCASCSMLKHVNPERKIAVKWVSAN